MNEKQEHIKSFFDNEITEGRRLLPSRTDFTGYGTMLKYENAVRLMNLPENNVILDLGCNKGSIEYLLNTKHPEALKTKRVHGIDIAQSAVEEAKQLNLPNCTFQSYTGGVLPYDDNTFDLIVNVEVIEHVVDKDLFLSEISRVLKPGGTLYMTTPNPKNWCLRFERTTWTILRKLFNKPPQDKDEFIRFRDLDKLFKANHLEVQGPHYAWPRISPQFDLWHIIPPLPPKGSYYFQKMVNSMFGGLQKPEFIAERIMWTLHCTCINRKK